MKQNKMFDLVIEDIEEVPGLEKWTLRQLKNQGDTNSTNISPIKVAALTKTFGEIQLGNTTLAVTQEHRFGQSPKPVRFSLPLEGVGGESILHSKNNGNLAILSGEIGSEEGKMFQLPVVVGSSQAVLDWLEELAEKTCWGI